MKLTKELLLQNAAALTAFANGMQVQYSDTPDDPSCDVWRDCYPDAVIWEMDRHLYRPKPAPKTRPWNRPEDVPLNCWLKTASGCAQVSGVYADGITYGSRDMTRVVFLSWQDLRGQQHSLDRKTWLPCVVTE